MSFALFLNEALTKVEKSINLFSEISKKFFVTYKQLSFLIIFIQIKVSSFLYLYLFVKLNNVYHNKKKRQILCQMSKEMF